MSHSSQSLIVIAAPRSGARLLRELLVQLPGCGTWPGGETNEIWRFGNRRHANDEFPTSFARPRVRRYVQRAFDRLARTNGLSTVVEYTGANCLRVPFVNQVLPQARFIHLIRDGRDVAVSARRAWTAPVTMGEVLRQARHVPCGALPGILSHTLVNHWHRLRSPEKRRYCWGPRHASLAADLHHGTLLEVCALQWKQGVDAATQAFRQVDSQRVQIVHYEHLVDQPVAQLRRIAAFLQIDPHPHDCQRLAAQVRGASLGTAQRLLDAEVYATIEALCEDTLLAHGYKLLAAAPSWGGPGPAETGAPATENRFVRRRAG
jgi:hypothetical protein